MKIVYYIRMILFILYLFCMFLLIDKILTVNVLGTIFFILSLIYSFILILTFLSKKKIFIEAISYNILNIGLYVYLFIIFYMSLISSKLDILNNKIYFRNNFILLNILLLSLIAFSLYLNKEEK